MRRMHRCNFKRLIILLIFIISLIVNITYILHLVFDKSFVRKPIQLVTDSGSYKPRVATIEVRSSKDVIEVKVDGIPVVSSKDSTDESSRGIHVVVLNEATAKVMSHRVFDTYSPHQDEAMILFLNLVSAGRILVFSIKDEGSFQLKKSARLLLQGLGSQLSGQLYWRDAWAMVTRKGLSGRDGLPYVEGRHSTPSLMEWADPVVLEGYVPLVPNSIPICPAAWPPNDASTHRRRAFCSAVEGYGSICSCEHPAPITFEPGELPTPDHLADVPVAVMASNRPQYLYRMLRSLLSARGAKPSSVTVYIDGTNNLEVVEVAKLFGVGWEEHTPLGDSVNSRISQHYKSSLDIIFSKQPSARFAIMLEEDLDVSLDFFTFFNQLVPVIREDASVYCVSAWNDLGYEHSVGDPTMVYRVETMPGLGWLLSSALYRRELEPRWPGPDKDWDWDQWMRLPAVRKARECLVPDVSRTYHFGSTGANLNPYFQETYFKKHAINKAVDVVLKDVDKLSEFEYENLLIELIKSSTLLDHSTYPCASDYFPEYSGKSYVLYIAMSDETDFSSWKHLAACLRIWDIDIRGVHKSAWRLFINQNHLVVIGVPASPYSELKPDDVIPVRFQSTSITVAATD